MRDRAASPPARRRKRAAVRTPDIITPADRKQIERRQRADKRTAVFVPREVQAEPISPGKAKRYERTSRGPTNEEGLRMAAEASLRRSGVEAHALRTGQRASGLLEATVGSKEELGRNIHQLRHPTRRRLDLGEVGRYGGAEGKGRAVDTGVLPWGPLGKAPSAIRAAAAAGKPKLADHLLEAAGVEHAFRVHAGHDPVVALKETADKYGIPLKKLRQHVNGKGKGIVKRILSNEEHWKEKPPTETPPQSVLPPEIQASADKITEALKGAKTISREQEKLRSPQRGARAGAAEQAMQDTPGGEAAFQAAKHELKGKYASVEFNALKDKFGQKEVDDLFTHIKQDENLRTFEKIRAHDSLKAALEGKVPTPSDNALLTQVFGPAFVQEINDSVSMFARFQNAGLEIANIPRSLMASFDLSAPFRQGLVAGAAHPKMFFENFEAMFKSAGSENAYHDILDEIYSRPNADNGFYERAKISFTELGGMTGREEQFPSGYAERLTGGKHGPVARSGRAYTAFLDKMRADMFDLLVERAQALGRDVEGDSKLLQDLGTFVNAATGRGSLSPKLANSAVALNTVFFSPRLFASRINFLNPFWYAKLDPFVRKEAWHAMRNLVGTAGAFLTLASMAGAEVGLDPRNADWAKIKIGNTRIDILGGFQQPIRLAAQMYSGIVISSTTGDPLSLGPGFGKLSRHDIFWRFIEGKYAPPAAMINDWAKGSDFQDKPFSVKREILQHTIPLMGQDAYDLYKDSGSAPLAVGGYAVGMFGLGLQTYGSTQTGTHLGDRRKTSLEKDSEAAGMGKPPPRVVEDLSWKTKLDQKIQRQATDNDGKIVYSKAVHIAANIFEERYGTTIRDDVQGEASAKKLYEIIRPLLYRDYAAWQRTVDKQLDHQLAGK